MGPRSGRIPVAELAEEFLRDHRINGRKSIANREMAVLKRMFRLGMHATPPEALRPPDSPEIAEVNARRGFLEDAQYSELFEASPELRSRALVEMGRAHG